MWTSSDNIKHVRLSLYVSIFSGNHWLCHGHFILVQNHQGTYTQREASHHWLWSVADTWKVCCICNTFYLLPSPASKIHSYDFVYGGLSIRQMFHVILVDSFANFVFPLSRSPSPSRLLSSCQFNDMLKYVLREWLGDICLMQTSSKCMYGCMWLEH